MAARKFALLRCGAFLFRLPALAIDHFLNPEIAETTEQNIYCRQFPL
jgi:hypothetical protein